MSKKIVIFGIIALVVFGCVLAAGCTTTTNNSVNPASGFISIGTSNGLTALESVTLTLPDVQNNGKKWYSSEREAINAYLKVTSVPTPEPIKNGKLVVPKGAIISASRTSGMKDDYSSSPKFVSTIKLTVNGQDLAWCAASSTAYDTSETEGGDPYKTITLTGANDNGDITMNFTKLGYQTVTSSAAPPANKITKDCTISIS